MRAFLAVAEGDQYGPVWQIALLTVLRRGELLALRWEGVDRDRGVLHVRRALVELGSKLVFQEPKTKSGRRVVAPNPSCVAALRTHRSTQLERRLALGPAWRDEGLVFTTADGARSRPAISSVAPASYAARRAFHRSASTTCGTPTRR